MSSYLEYYGLIEEEGRGASGGLDPVNWERAQEDWKKEVYLDYSFTEKLKKIYYDNNLPDVIDNEILDFLNNKLWNDGEFLSNKDGFVQPWRENFFVFYGDGKVFVKHGDFGNVYFDVNMLAETKEIYLIGHTHTAAAYQLPTAPKKWTGLFLRNHYSEKLGTDIIEVCDSGIPSDVDLRFGSDISSFEIQLNKKILNVVVGEQFVTFYKGNVESVYDIDTGEKVGTDIKYTTVALDYLARQDNEIFKVEGFSSVELVGDNGSTFYDIFGNKTGGTGGSQKELRKVSGGIKVSSQGYVSLEY